MSDRAAGDVYVYATTVSGGVEIHATRPDAGDDARCDFVIAASNLVSSVGRLAKFIGAGHCITYAAEPLQDLLSSPQVLRQTRPILGRIQDLRDLALIVAPLAGDFSLAGLCRYLAIGLPADAAAIADALPTVEQALLDRLRALPAGLQSILQGLLGAEDRFARLPWQGEAPMLAFAGDRLGRILPRRPRAVKREPEGLDGEIEVLAAQALEPGGGVSAQHPAYESRPGQVQMAAAVARALRDEEFLLVEAGTGVGKSLAYLVPAILWAREAGEPVVISTNTKNLQQQLMASDLPLLRRALPVGFEAALLKGRGNYACVRSLAAAISDASGSLFLAERMAVAHLASWLSQSNTGDLDELATDARQMLPPLGGLVERVRSDGYACPGKACSQYDVCPVEIARTKARNADVVVVNHALLLAETQTAVLPPYTRLIIDEAHNLETVATDCLGLEASRFSLHALQRAVHDEPASLVESLRRRPTDLDDRAGIEMVEATLSQIPPLAEEAFGRLSDWGEQVFDFCTDTARAGRRPERLSLRLTEEVRRGSGWQQLASDCAEALAAGHELLSGLRALATALTECDTSGTEATETLATDAEAVVKRVEEFLHGLATIVGAEGHIGEYVTWAEAWEGRFGADWSLRAAPVDIGSVLSEVLFQHKQSVVFTSATLTVDGAFRFFRQRVGLGAHQDRLVELEVPSSFCLPEQLLLCVPGDFPLPDDSGFGGAVVSAIGEIAAVTRGGTLVLFTSRAAMTSAYEALRRSLQASGLQLLAQDISGSRWNLIERLKEDEGTVLFGLKSFWEGVDVPGSALRCVVIAKLPFAVPDDPIVEARQEHVRGLGLDPLRDYYIPDAILGFKQGLGRLIRTASDRGVVFVLDRRLLVRGYGRRFFKSVPRCAFSRQELCEALRAVGEWLR